MLIVVGTKVDFLLLVFVVSADDDLYFVFQAEIHDIVSCLIEKVVDLAGSFLYTFMPIFRTSRVFAFLSVSSFSAYILSSLSLKSI